MQLAVREPRRKRSRERCASEDWQRRESLADAERLMRSQSKSGSNLVMGGDVSASSPL
jgi:hypothetical protein